PSPPPRGVQAAAHGSGGTGLVGTAPGEMQGLNRLGQIAGIQPGLQLVQMGLFFLYVRLPQHGLSGPDGAYQRGLATHNIQRATPEQRSEERRVGQEGRTARSAEPHKVYV